MYYGTMSIILWIPTINKKLLKDQTKCLKDKVAFCNMNYVYKMFNDLTINRFKWWEKNGGGQLA